MAPLNSRLRLKLPNSILILQRLILNEKNLGIFIDGIYIYIGGVCGSLPKKNRRPYESLKGVFIKNKPGCLGSFWINLSDCLNK